MAVLGTIPKAVPSRGRRTVSARQGTAQSGGPASEMSNTGTPIR